MIWHNQPGSGLGFTASKQIAHGLGTPFEIGEMIVEVFESAYSFIKAFIQKGFTRETV
jgi:hypothetical protein